MTKANEICRHPMVKGEVGGMVAGMSMTVPLPETARVHHQTVTDHSEGVRHFPRPRLRAVQSDTAMTTFKVNPNVWAIALKAAEGDAHRIEIHDEYNVTVHNTRQW